MLVFLLARYFYTKFFLLFSTRMLSLAYLHFEATHALYFFKEEPVDEKNNIVISSCLPYLPGDEQDPLGR